MSGTYLLNLCLGDPKEGGAFQALMRLGLVQLVRRFQHLYLADQQLSRLAVAAGPHC